MQRAIIYSRFLFAVCFMVALSIVTVAQPQANKPNTQTQVPGPTQTVNTVQAAYSSGIKINFVRIREAIKPITDTTNFNAATYLDVKEITEYYDGLGRPVEEVNRQISPNVKDMVLSKIYDEFGQEKYK